MEISATLFQLDRLKCDKLVDNFRFSFVAWSDVCKPKKEGGLGFQSLQIANKTTCLKLIWRIVSGIDSMWVAWISNVYLKGKSFWIIKENSSLGSWMWRKILKYKEIAKQFHKVEVRNGLSCSFWHDNWSHLGCLYGIMGSRGFIDLGIPSEATLEEAKRAHRRRRYRTDDLRRIDQALGTLSLCDGEDISLWRSTNDKYKNKFNTKSTRSLIRTAQPLKDWYKGIWFTHATPKYSFFSWLAINNRLSTGDRLRQWSSTQQTSCSFCGTLDETRDHLFFSCPFSAQVWTLPHEQVSRE